jgi:hypothetical protein
MPVGSGRIKAGEGSLIGNAGEFYVVAELLKRGTIAALAPRNTPVFDILATRKDRTVRIRVKTKSEEYPEWQWVVKKDGAIFRSLSDDSDFTVLVNLAMDNKELRFYVVPTMTVDRWLKEDFEEWLRTPGKFGRAHSTTNKKRHLNEDKHAHDLSQSLGRWDLLWS